MGGKKPGPSVLPSESQLPVDPGNTLSGKAWDNMLQNKTAFTTKDYGRGEREAQWAMAQRTLHGLQTPESANGLFNDKNSYRELSELAEHAKRRAEVARYNVCTTERPLLYQNGPL